MRGKRIGISSQQPCWDLRKRMRKQWKQIPWCLYIICSRGSAFISSVLIIKKRSKLHSKRCPILRTMPHWVLGWDYVNNSLARIFVVLRWWEQWNRARKQQRPCLTKPSFVSIMIWIHMSYVSMKCRHLCLAERTIHVLDLQGHQMDGLWCSWIRVFHQPFARMHPIESITLRQCPTKSFLKGQVVCSASSSK